MHTPTLTYPTLLQFWLKVRLIYIRTGDKLMGFSGVTRAVMLLSAARACAVVTLDQRAGAAERTRLATNNRICLYFQKSPPRATVTGGMRCFYGIFNVYRGVYRIADE